MLTSWRKKLKPIKTQEMNINKGSQTLNYIFGAFILLSSVKIGADLYSKYKSKSGTKSCGCKKA